MMVEPNVERILIVHPTWTGEIVVEQARTVRHWVQIGNIRTRRIDDCRRDHVQLAVVADRIAELNAYGLPGFRIRINARIVASAKRDPKTGDRKSTRLNSSHLGISYAVFCLKKKKKK